MKNSKLKKITIEDKKISIIIPVFNTNPKFLKKCLESVVNQTFSAEKFEIIVIDDGSTNAETLNFLKKFTHKNLKIFYLGKNYGTPSVARNKGIEFSKGKYVFFVDSDDHISPYTLEFTYNFTEKYDPDVLFFKTITGKFGGELLPLNNKYLAEKQLNCVLSEKNYCYETFPIIAQLIKRKLLVENHIRFNENFSYAEDRHFGVLVNLYAEKFAKIPDFPFYYVVTDDFSAEKNMSPASAFAEHLTKTKTKFSDFAVTLQIITDVVNSNVSCKRKAQYLQNIYGASNIFTIPVSTLEFHLKSGNFFKILEDANALTENISDEILEFYTENNKNIVAAIRNEDIGLWLECVRKNK